MNLLYINLSKMFLGALLKTGAWTNQIIFNHFLERKLAKLIMYYKMGKLNILEIKVNIKYMNYYLRQYSSKITIRNLKHKLALSFLIPDW